MKVLIISHNPISTNNNMGKTFLSLFAEFQNSEMCQLYTYPGYPNLERCTSYYRVTDKDMVSFLLRLRIPGGEVAREKIHAEQRMYEDAADEAFFRNVKNKSPLRRLLRDLIWQIAPWNNKRLKQWLEKENPTCIFVAPGAARFLYDLTLWVSRMRNIPIVTYICDEYYFLKPEKTLLGKLRLALLQRKFRSLMARTARIVTISDEFRQKYTEVFPVPAVTVMTGSSLSRAVDPADCRQAKTISYFGNVRINRYVSLAQVGRALDRLNKADGTAYKLIIYTGDKNQEILNTLSQIPSVELHDFLRGEEFENALVSADLLLHVEAFDEDSIDYVKHSVSTKIADTLKSGVPLIAYGPAQISSMQHLARHECAHMIYREEDLEQQLRQVFTDREKMIQYARKGQLTAEKYHNSRHNSRILHEVLECVGK